MIRVFAPLVTTLALAACSTAQVAQVEPIDGAVSGECHTDTVRGAIGLAASAQTVERARVDSDSSTVELVRGTRDSTGATSSGADDPDHDTRQSGGSQLTIERGPTNNITSMHCG